MSILSTSFVPFPLFEFLVDIVSAHINSAVHSFQSYAVTFARCTHVISRPISKSHTITMARSKTATPIKRTPSETYKQSNGVSHQLDDAVHSIEKKIEEQAELHARNPKEQKEAGLLQLLICVGGIYASL